jgi:signal transduction histidine kinase
VERWKQYRRGVGSWRQWWRHSRGQHGDRVDAALVVLSAVVLASALGASDVRNQLASAGLSAAALLMFLGRRRAPLAVSLLAFAMLGAGVALPVDITPAQFFGLLAVFGLVGGVNRLRDAILGWVAGAVVLAYAMTHQPAGGRVGDFVLSLAFCTTVWAGGAVLTRRSRHLAAAQDWARRAEESRAAHAEAAIVEERARIAGELHDIVSHGLSVVIVQTVAARQSLADAEPVDADRRLAAVESTAREALADMRRMLGLLQVEPDGDGPGPSPGLGQLPQLVERARAAGLDVTVAGADAVPDLTPGVDLTAYRTVQEGLTNALRHAPRSAVRVSIDVVDAALEVSVHNDAGDVATGESAGAGRGLVGLRHRAELYGGRCEAGPVPGGGFEVRLRLPMSPEAVPSVSRWGPFS